MARVQLPMPPNPLAPTYSNNRTQYEMDLYNCLIQWRGLLEQVTRQNSAPATNPIVLGTYTASNTVTGTATGTDVANMLCTVVNALTQRGILAPTTSRNSTT